MYISILLCIYIHCSIPMYTLYMCIHSYLSAYVGTSSEYILVYMYILVHMYILVDMYVYICSVYNVHMYILSIDLHTNPHLYVIGMTSVGLVNRVPVWRPLLTRTKDDIYAFAHM